MRTRNAHIVDVVTEQCLFYGCRTRYIVGGGSFDVPDDRIACPRRNLTADNRKMQDYVTFFFARSTDADKILVSY
jgi:hypothetical protein